MRIVMRCIPEQPVRELARFTMVNGALKVEYLSDSYRMDVEFNGIFDPIKGELFPRDGENFYNALLRAYSNSSTMDVVDVP